MHTGIGRLLLSTVTKSRNILKGVITDTAIQNYETIREQTRVTKQINKGDHATIFIQASAGVVEVASTPVVFCG